MKKILFFFFLLWLSLPYPLHSQEEKPSELFAKAYPLFSEAKLSQAEDLFLKNIKSRISAGGLLALFPRHARFFRR